jgi:hypothetical protein
MGFHRVHLDSSLHRPPLLGSVADVFGVVLVLKIIECKHLAGT